MVLKKAGDAVLLDRRAIYANDTPCVCAGRGQAAFLSYRPE